MASIQSSYPLAEMFGSVGHVLGPVPQMLLGIAMVMVLFENERKAVQENTLALSTLGVDPRRLLSADDLLPFMYVGARFLMKPFRRLAPSVRRSRRAAEIPGVPQAMGVGKC